MKPVAAYTYVLTALADGPSHGLGIADNVAEFTQGAVLLGPGTLYRCLRDLAAEGLIDRVEVLEDTSSPHRKHYQLTELGPSTPRR